MKKKFLFYLGICAFSFIFFLSSKSLNARIRWKEEKCFSSQNNIDNNLYINISHISLVQAEQVETCKLLLKDDPSLILKKTLDQRRTLLHFAVHYQSPKLTELFLSAGALVDSKDSHGVTPLHYAVTEDSLEIVQLLVKYHATLDVEDDGGELPLHYAVSASSDNSAIIKYLVEISPDINIPDHAGNTALHMAVMHRNVFAVKQLIARGAQVNRANAQGFTPVYYALLTQNTYLLDLLIQAGVDLRIKQGGRPLIFVALEFCSKKQLSIMRTLIKNGVDIYSRYNRITPIQYAELLNKHELADLLKKEFNEELSRL